MARDDNDRPYDDGQGRPVNPDLTGDVLSPRWSTDDTDEQPAIQITGNETYILPSDGGAPGDPYQSESAYPETGAFAAAPSGLRDEGHLDAQTPAYSDGYAESPHHTDPEAPAYAESPHLTDADGAYRTDADAYSDAYSDAYGADRYAGDAPSDPRRAGEDEAGYLPLDRGYEEPGEEPQRGFLGSGWTGSTDDDYGHGDGEVRRRTRLLLAAAAAVVVLGVGAGWMLTGTSSDDPCADGRCASVGDLSTPAVQEDTGDEVPVEEATDTATPEPSATRSETPTAAPTAQARVRPTRTATAEPEPEPEPTPTRTRTQTRAPEPDPEPSGRATRAPVQETDDVELTDRPEPRRTQEDTPSEPVDDPITEMPEPEENRRGLFDILFPWA